jgi:hypothetical protein
MEGAPIAALLSYFSILNSYGLIPNDSINFAITSFRGKAFLIASPRFPRVAAADASAQLCFNSSY